MAQTDPQTPAQTPTPLVCIIEDDADLRVIYRMLLGRAGYRVTEAVDGLAGYTLLRDAPERVIALVDYKLPAMDGCDLLELIATDEQLRSRHAFIMVTATPQYAEQDCGETLDALETPIVPKPFTPPGLLAAVAAAAARIAA
jgi:CheY-like chemotaxis protein